MSETQYEIRYNLRFYRLREDGNVDDKYVTFTCSLTAYEIDTLTFLLAEYFDQQHLFDFDKLTFFNQYKYVIDVIKRDYEVKSDSETEIKQIFQLFINNDFIGQVPCFQLIIKRVGVYLNRPNGVEPVFCDECATVGKLRCIMCRAVYMSEALSLMDAGLQNGWDIFFRPMLGIPLLFFVLLKSDTLDVDDEEFNVDGIITNMLLQFFLNLLSDRTTPQYWNFGKCNSVIETCREYMLGIKDCEHLLSNLNDVTYKTKIYTPLRQFMEKCFNVKQQGKLVHKVFIGFFLRVFLEAKKRNDQRALAKGARNVVVCLPANLETRNVCRVLFKDYSDSEFEEVIDKLVGIKSYLLGVVTQNYIAPKQCVMRMFNQYRLNNDVSRLLQRSAFIN
ncbi:p48/p45 [Clostera anastomosis granulovirus A]|uniref:P48/p45 n=1 Tax=Clostera anastomosis granulovirus A TaxID=1986289 RepID=U5KBU7_9BBAC|nr:p48/p45 [Clostera anastomosis granulovirus Henan]AGQ20329.1 p48/p45 [Clostera anastomosis granulovirus Henan]